MGISEYKTSLLHGYRSFLRYIIRNCRLHSFPDISLKAEVIDTNYVWYGGVIIYKNIS